MATKQRKSNKARRPLKKGKALKSVRPLDSKYVGLMQSSTQQIWQSYTQSYQQVNNK